MFKEALQELVEGTEGGLAGLLMDSSGIALESYAKDDSPFDINTIGIEFSVVIGSIKRASEMLEAGAANEIAVAAFLAHRIGFLDIAAVVEATLEALGPLPADTLDAVIGLDVHARRVANDYVATRQAARAA